MDLENIHSDFSKKTLILMAVISVSFASIFVRWSDSHPVSISFYRMFFSFLIIVPFLPKYMDRLKSLNVNQWIKLVSAGLFLGVHMFLWISSLEYTSVVSSVVLVTSHPLVVVWISGKILDEKAERKIYLGIFLSLFGVFLMSLSNYRAGEWSLFGDLLAILGMFAMSGYIIRGRQIRQKIKTVPYVSIVYGVSTVAILALSPLFESPIQTFQAREYLIFLSLAIIPTVIGHTLYNWGLKYVEARIVSISLLGEPVGASILALVILEEVPPILTAIGAAIVLCGIYLSIRES